MASKKKTSSHENSLDMAELALAKEEEEPPLSQKKLRHRRRSSTQSQFDVLAAELSALEEENKDGVKPDGDSEPSAAAVATGGDAPPHPFRPHLPSSLRIPHQKSFWYRMAKTEGKQKGTKDPYFDSFEDSKNKHGKEINVPSIKECQRDLQTKEVELAQAHRQRKLSPWRRLSDPVLNIVAALYIYLINIISIEAAIVVLNTALCTTFYCWNASDYAVKLDFSFLAFAVIFPLTFLIQSAFGRRNQALDAMADFKAGVLTTALFTLTVDWSNKNGDPTKGRLTLPENFNANVVQDCRQLVRLVYAYLSMHTVGHARYIAFSMMKEDASKRVHAIQNDLVKQLNSVMFDLAMHTEEMRKWGFPSGEASRLHQYHQYLQQRFEKLRILKYYRTPQATRSFGRAYIMILPWISGPYFAWVFQSTSYAYAITLASFTFLVVFGLLNTQQELEDPFLSDPNSWTPGIDNVKLDFEMAVTLQAIQQYYANAELRQSWERQHDIERKKRILAGAPISESYQVP